MYKWDVYEITIKETPIHGVRLRGRLRKYALSKNINLLTENASDKENVVRFALEENDNPEEIKHFLKSLIEDAEINLIEKSLSNPILSKMKVNIESRYSI